MSSPFIGEIRMFGGNFAPTGWAFCNGQTIAIDQNTTLFQLIGTTYGGNGQSTFMLPNLQSRIPLHEGTLGGVSYVIGEMAGTENITLTTQQIPAHNHGLIASAAAATTGNVGGLPAEPPTSASNPIYTNTVDTTMANTMIGLSGGNQPHNNIQPILAVSFIISLFGIFPSRN